MTPLQIVILLAMTAYAVYRQSIRHEIVGASRFKLAIIYAAIGVVGGGFALPSNGVAWATLVGGALLSLAVGVARGRLSKLWRTPDGRVFSQGTPLTIGLFLGLVGAKFALGAWLYLHQLAEHGGFGEVLLLIGIMVAVQAEVLWRRAAPTTGREGRPAELLEAV